MTLEQELQEERRLRILIEREYHELKAKYDLLVSRTPDNKTPNTNHRGNVQL
jgi:hypothetical protein